MVRQETVGGWRKKKQEYFGLSRDNEGTSHGERLLVWQWEISRNTARGNTAKRCNESDGLHDCGLHRDAQSVGCAVDSNF